VSEPREALLAVADLTVEFRTRSGTVHALDGVGFEVGTGEVVGLVGESGSGKSVTAYAIAGILDPAGRVVSGSARFRGRDLLSAGETAMQQVRGRELSMIFQNPRAALNPIRTVGRQIEDVLRRHAGLSGSAARARAVELLASVGIADPERRCEAYPFELSGGMCQRVMIAMALSCSPSLLIADEPATGLDVTTQAVIMDLMADLVAAREMSAVLITHDLALAAEHCDRIVVMHAGHVVEAAPTAALFAAPRHPYTARLIAATPRRSLRLAGLDNIPGGLPDLHRGDLPPCRYSARCERYLAACDAGPLPRVVVAPGHMVACRRLP
jgi:peptide/nickel transport system ATP-binding protein